MAGQRELEWRVNDLHLAGLSWGEAGGRPVLALHGWLDNAASFTRLAPLLHGCHVVAPDLTGHGRSAWRSPDAGYQIWDDLPELLGIVDQLGWDRFDLVGHSRGAIIAALLAAACPERVGHLALLDGYAPEPLPGSAFPGQLRRFLDDKLRLQARQPRRVGSLEQAVALRAAGSLPADAARLLAERNLGGEDGRRYWRTDPRLRGASAMKLGEEHIAAALDALSMPVLLLLAERGLAATHADYAARAGRMLAAASIETVAGGHHFHLEPVVETVAARLRIFFTGAA
jgi:pimeloyl-ACP methyl ester carboxylesterase